MSLAEKLYKIGECIDSNDFAQDLRQDIENLDDYNFIVLNLSVSIKSKNRIEWTVVIEPNYIQKFNLNKEKLFLTKKIGGSGSGTIYLYPNVINKDTQKGLTQNIVSIENSVLKHTKKYKRVLSKILQILKNDKAEILTQLEATKATAKTIFITLINGKTFYELCPEVLTNFAGNPIKRGKNIKLSGSSFFTEDLAPIGFKPDINFFNTDNYNGTMKDKEVHEKIPLHELDGANINKGWLFCDKQGFLKKEYERLKFYIIPSSQDKQLTKKLVDKIKTAKGLSHFSDATSKSFFEEIKMMSDWLVGNEQTNIVTFDFIFYEDNNNQREIFGTIQDVMPSQINQIWDLMYDFKDFTISDGFYKLSQKDSETVYLMDYFCRNALWARFNGKEMDKVGTSYKYKRFLANERIFLASLLLGRQKINMDELLKLVNKNVNYEFTTKGSSHSIGEYLRMDEGIKTYLKFPKDIALKHRILIAFLNKINALKG
ncbi:hypothetical protein [Sulfurovum mangrovi]|uniref:hypothetical protein n=1 Tax=Sulfurovum mangrovi TaxID=2893889 RepID=UPI001E299C45|nr:hypothetical protein [Sulfurovum mangrovi]UFH60006.1 hypothetical protein LN246_03950 [Sulfurovum mangrovi]